MKNRITLVVPLESHEAIVAALVLCDMIGNDNKAVVMALGVSGDFKEHTGIALGDYDLEDLLTDEDWFSDYPDVCLSVSFEGPNES